MAATLRRRGCRLFDHAQFAEPLRDEIRHHFGRVLQIETTVNDVTFFKPHRWGEHRDGTRSMPWASVRKTLYRLGVLAELLGASNRRYLKFVSAWDLPGVGIRAVEKVARPARERGRCYPGFILFHGDDLDLFLTLARGEFANSGLCNRHLQPALGKTSSRISRLLKRLRLHGLIKRIRRTYKRTSWQRSWVAYPRLFAWACSITKQPNRTRVPPKKSARSRARLAMDRPIERPKPVQ